jgi:hypothetical protein
MIKVYNTHDELLIYLICMSVVLKNFFFSYMMKYSIMVTQNYFN